MDLDNYLDTVVAPNMSRADWIRSLGLAVVEVTEQIANDVDQGTLPPTVGSYSKLHDHVDANEYPLASPTCARVWSQAKSADDALPFLNAVTAACDAILRADQPQQQTDQGDEDDDDGADLGRDLKMYAVDGKVVITKRGEIAATATQTAGHWFVEPAENAWFPLDPDDEVTVYAALES